MAHPYKNTGKCGTKSPVKQRWKDKKEWKDALTLGSPKQIWNNIIHGPSNPNMKGGNVLGPMFAIPMGIKNAIQNFGKNKVSMDAAQVGAGLTPVEDTPPGALSEDPDMKI